MPPVIVGVHGIAQEQLGRHQIEPSWKSALCDGVELAVRSPLDTEIDVRVAFYGDLFLKRFHAEKSPEDRFTHLTQDEEIYLNDALDELGEHYRTLPSAQKMRIPGSSVLRRADALIGNRATGLLYLGELRQVRRYLLDPSIKAEAESRIDRHMHDNVRILIGHSLGSVVALEYLRTRPNVQVDLLLTIGSPLGLRMVRELMEEPSFAMNGLPTNLSEWVNVFDPADPVACASPLSRLWPAVKDRRVHNGSKPHSAIRYLGKEESGRAIIDGLGLSAT